MIFLNQFTTLLNEFVFKYSQQNQCILKNGTSGRRYLFHQLIVTGSSLDSGTFWNNSRVYYEPWVPSMSLVDSTLSRVRIFPQADSLIPASLLGRKPFWVCLSSFNPLDHFYISKHSLFIDTFLAALIYSHIKLFTISSLILNILPNS